MTLGSVQQHKNRQYIPCSVMCTILINHRMFNTEIKYQEAEFPLEKPVSLVRELKKDLTDPVALTCILIERNLPNRNAKHSFIISQLQFNGCAINTLDWRALIFEEDSNLRVPYTCLGFFC